MPPSRLPTRTALVAALQVIRASKDLEWILEAYLGAHGKGLHEKCTSVQHCIPKVRRVAATAVAGTPPKVLLSGLTWCLLL